ncbi:MAG: glycosyltransferase family 4 protein [Pseudomonadota bacterium]
MLENSELFDAEWYSGRYSNSIENGLDPASCFLQNGARRRQSPSPKFDGAAYLTDYPDVAEAGVNPLLHYLRNGISEGRRYSHLIDYEASKAWSAQRSSDRPLVVFESHDLDIQGAQTSLFEIASGVHADGRYEAVLSSAKPGPMAQAYKQMGIPAFFHCTPPIGACVDPEFYLERLDQHYRSINPAIIHINTLANALPAVAAHRAGIPFVWNVREGGDPMAYLGLLPPNLMSEVQYVFRQASEVIFVAKATRDEMCDTLEMPSRVSTIPNGVDPKALVAHAPVHDRAAMRDRLGLKPEDVLVLIVGTVCERKGQLDLIRAAPYLNRLVDGEIVIAFLGLTQNSYSRALREAVVAQKHDRVRVLLLDHTAGLEERPQALAHYRAADVFVLTSRMESYPRVTLEAMAFGLPIVSTPCAGVVEQLQNNVSALFYPAGDAEALASQLNRLLDDPEARIRFGLAARERLDKLLSYSQMVRAYVAAYDRVLTST